MKVKKILCLILSVCMTASVSAIPTVSAETSTNDCSEGAIFLSENEINEYFGAPINFSNKRASLPSSVDLSQSPCFPPIADQGDLGSCASFATTYYQYSYEVNMLNGVKSANDRVIYSPKWTYNLINGGEDIGSSLSQNYMVLQNFGCLKNSDFTYTGNKNDYTEWPADMVSQKIEALKTRIANRYNTTVYENSTVPTSSQLNGVKTLLNNGKILTVESTNRWNSAVVNGQSIAFRCYAGGSHALTVVGYDDNKSYDVNGNGTIEDCEKGAFKVANSWGKNFDSYGIKSNNGYFWVLYDALNGTSLNKVNNWEENYTGIRRSAFIRGNFYFIDVTHVDVNLIGKIYLQTSNREAIQLKINRNNANVTSWTDTDSTVLYPYNGTGTSNIAFNGTILFDYGKYANPVSLCSDGYNWYSALSGSYLNVSSNSFVLTDDLGNIITDNKVLSGAPLANYHNLSLKKGDIDYDESITSSDATILLNYLSNQILLSNLQYYLADFNNNGRVDVSDLIGLNNYISNNSSSSKELAEAYKLNLEVKQFLIENNYQKSEIEKIDKLSKQIQQQFEEVD